MSRIFAVVEAGRVVNVIVADQWPGGIDVTDSEPRPSPGGAYDGQSFAPAPPASEQATTPKMTHLGFIDRMLPEEWARFEGLLAQSAEARFAKAKFDVARDVDVSRADVQGFAYTLRAVGVLASDDRVAALLAPIDVASPHALT